MKCSKCESTNVREINVEMAFARGKAEPIYVAGSPVVCLECGFAGIFVPRGPLAQLRDGVPPQYSRPDFNGGSTQIKSQRCA